MPSRIPLILTATLADLHDVYQVAAKSFTSPWPREAFEEDLKRDWTAIRVLRPVEGADICGFSHFWLVGDEAQLQHLAVLPEMRRLGHGRALLNDLVTTARQRSAKEIWLEVRRSNRAALNLYYGAGFERAGVRPRYYADNDEDAIVAKLPLYPEGPKTR